MRKPGGRLRQGGSCVVVVVVVVVRLGQALDASLLCCDCGWSCCWRRRLDTNATAVAVAEEGLMLTVVALLLLAQVTEANVVVSELFNGPLLSLSQSA